MYSFQSAYTTNNMESNFYNQPTIPNNHYVTNSQSEDNANLPTSVPYYQQQEKYYPTSTSYYDPQAQSSYKPFHFSSYSESSNNYPFHQANYANFYLNNQSQNNQINLQNKSLTPPPSAMSANFTISQPDQITPEKPIMNDSGIDVISPQLSILGTNQNQQQFIMTSSHENSIQSVISQKNSLKSDPIKTNEPEIQENEDEGDDKETDDENEDNNITENEDKENATTANKSMSSSKPPKPYLEIIAQIILSSNVKMMQLHDIYKAMQKKYQYFAKNINKSWRNSVRHNLSLNECFTKAGRGSNGKGNYWRIHPLCEKEFIRGNFRRKSFKQLIKAGGESYNAPRVPPTSSLAYGIPFSEYSTNIKTMPYMFPPPPPPQNFQPINSNLASFQYPFQMNQYQNSSYVQH